MDARRRAVVFSMAMISMDGIHGYQRSSILIYITQASLACHKLPASIRYTRTKPLGNTSTVRSHGALQSSSRSWGWLAGHGKHMLVHKLPNLDHTCLAGPVLVILAEQLCVGCALCVVKCKLAKANCKQVVTLAWCLTGFAHSSNCGQAPSRWLGS